MLVLVLWILLISACQLHAKLLWTVRGVPSLWLNTMKSYCLLLPSGTVLSPVSYWSLWTHSSQPPSWLIWNQYICIWPSDGWSHLAGLAQLLFGSAWRQCSQDGHLYSWLYPYHLLLMALALPASSQAIVSRDLLCVPNYIIVTWSVPWVWLLLHLKHSP